MDDMRKGVTRGHADGFMGRVMRALKDRFGEPGPAGRPDDPRDYFRIPPPPAPIPPDDPDILDIPPPPPTVPPGLTARLWRAIRQVGGIGKSAPPGRASLDMFGPPPATDNPMDDMLKDLPRGVSTRKLDEHKTPSSEWADPGRMAKSAAFAYDGGKVLLGVLGGVVNDDGREYYVTGGTPIGVGDDRHFVLCAGSRAGKGRSVLIPTLLDYEGSVFAIDPKGELADITARRRSSARGFGGLGQRVCIVDPFGITAERLRALRCGFNPITLLARGSATMIEDAGLIADALVPTESRDPHWDESARILVEGLLLHVATWSGFEGRRNLDTVRKVLTKGAAHKTSGKQFKGLPGLALQMDANADAIARGDSGVRPEVGEVIAGAANDFFDRPEGERGSVLSTARRHMKFLDYPPLSNSLAERGPEHAHRFDLTQLKTEALTVYLCLPPAHMATCSRWFRLFVNLAIEAMQREKQKPAIPVLAVLEEFNVLGHMRQLEVAAGLVAGFGMKLMVVLQDLTQLKRHYRDGWETFLGNAGVLMFFGNSDMTTLDFISKRCGPTSLIVDRGSDVSTAQALKGASGKSWSLEVKELITPEEASRFFGRDDRLQRALVIRTGMPPIIVQRVKYDRHEMFTGEWDAQ